MGLIFPDWHAAWGNEWFKIGWYSNKMDRTCVDTMLSTFYIVNLII
jgi:hypothetical protein